MTNLQKEASTLISDILDLELGVGDIVEYDTENGLTERVVMHTGIHIALLIDGTFRKLKDLKLKQRNITLPMVLRAMNEKEVAYIITFCDDNKIISLFWNHRYYSWQLRKDGKDLNLFDQKNEKLYKFLVEVLK